MVILINSVSIDNKNKSPSSMSSSASTILVTPLMHKFFGTQNQGMVRFSFSYYNTVDEINEAAEALMQIAALR